MSWGDETDHDPGYPERRTVPRSIKEQYRRRQPKPFRYRVIVWSRHNGAISNVAWSGHWFIAAIWAFLRVRFVGYDQVEIRWSTE